MIKVAQISPFDYCNNKCWYCPVKYYQQPVDYIQHMEPELFEKIIKNLVEEKGNLVAETFDFIYTAHYNEIIMYKYLEEMLTTLRKYGIKTMILSNGVAFTKDKIDIIKKYKDVVIGINFNTPTLNGTKLKKYVGQDQEIVGELIYNIRKVQDEFGNIFSIGMNGQDQNKVNADVAYAKSLFPDVSIYPVVGLCDRAGLLIDKCILDNRAEIERNKAGKTDITGCKNAERLKEWIHINSKGEAFTCCDDYFFEYTFGDFKTQELKDIWDSNKYKEAIKNSLEDMCPQCSFAIWN